MGGNSRTVPAGHGLAGSRRKTPAETPRGTGPRPGPQPTLELINGELEKRLGRQNEFVAKIDTKAVLLVGFAATAAQFLATRQHVQVVFAALAYAAYGISFVSGVAALAVTRFRDIEPRPLFDRYESFPKDHVLAVLCAVRVKTFEHNDRRHKRKVRCWWISLLALSGGLFLSIFALLHTGHHGT